MNVSPGAPTYSRVKFAICGQNRPGSDNTIDHQLLRAGLWKGLPVVWKRKKLMATHHTPLNFMCLTFLAIADDFPNSAPANASATSISRAPQLMTVERFAASTPTMAILARLRTSAPTPPTLAPCTMVAPAAASQPRLGIARAEHLRLPQQVVIVGDMEYSILGGKKV